MKVGEACNPILCPVNVIEFCSFEIHDSRSDSKALLDAKAHAAVPFTDGAASKMDRDFSARWSVIVWEPGLLLVFAYCGSDMQCRVFRG